MFSTKDHSCLNYTGRVVYNYYIQQRKNAPYEIHKKDHWVRTSAPKIKIQLGSEHNVFRVDQSSALHGNLDRCYSITVNKISDMIIAKRWVDKSILKEMELLGNSISSSTYSNSFSLGSVATSNVEIHYFSKHKLHVAHIASLGTYSSMNFTCFDAIDNASMQKIFIGQKDNVDDVMSVHLSQIIGIFFCESSRNPSAFLTIPMCLELADKIYSFLSHDEQRTRNILDEVHNVSSTYQKLLEDQKKPNISCQEQARITKEISQFIDLSTDISTTPKSNVVKDVILSLFPLAMKNAVQASREISMHINAIFRKKNVTNIDKLDHKYDTSIRGSLSDAKKYLKLENTLIQQYKKHVLEDTDTDIDYTTIVKNWFDLDINIASCDVLITGLVDPHHPLADVN